MADSGAPRGAAGERATDPALEDVLRAAGFEVTDAGRRRWRAELSRPVPQATWDEGQRMLDRARGRAA